MILLIGTYIQPASYAAIEWNSKRARDENMGDVHAGILAACPRDVSLSF
ncbi:MAG: hypothetical protein ACLFSB_09675 [Chitinispirillaceae bacterium]